MFSGAGVVAGGNRASSIRCRKRLTGLGDAATHSQIFYNLGIGRVHFVASASLLYFIDSKDSCIPDIVAPVFQGLGSKPAYEQMFLDPHGLLKGAIRLPLLAPHVAPVLAALRLSGIDISVASQTPSPDTET